MSLKMKHFTFGPFTLDIANNLLLCGQKTVPLPPKAFDTLVYLVENSQRLVTREELMKAVWPDSFVEDANLTVNVSLLRKALGDFGEGRLYIETVPRRGYRFNAEVKPIEEQADAKRPLAEPVSGLGRVVPTEPLASEAPGLSSRRAEAVALQPLLHQVIAFPDPRPTADISVPQPPTPATPVPEHGRRASFPWIAAGVLVIALICLGAALLLRHRSPSTAAFQQVRLTSFAAPMAVSAAAISSGSKFIAYANPAGLFIQVINGGDTHPLPLPEPGFTVSSISWFPDSAQLLVAGSAPQDDTESLWIVPVIGSGPAVRLGAYPAGVISPDGSEIALADLAGAAPKIELMRSDGSGWRTLVTGSDGEVFGAPSWSPSGKRVLFVRYRWDPQFRTNAGSIDSCDVATGRVSIVLSGADFAGAVASLPDGRVIYSLIPVANPAAHGGELLAVRTDAGTGRASSPPAVIAKWDSPLTGLSVNRAGTRLAVRDLVVQHNAYVGDLADGGTRLENVRRFSFVAGGEDLPRAWAPDGRAVFIDSNRFGHWEIFRRPLENGADTPFVQGAGDEFSPRVSPDGKWLLYLSRPVNWQAPQPVSLMRVPLSGGAPQLVLSAAGYATWGLRFECPRRAGIPCVLAQRQGNQIVFRPLDPLRGFENGEIGDAPFISASHFSWALAPDGSRLAWTEWSPVSAHIHILPLVDQGGALKAGGKEYTVAVGDQTHLHSIIWAPDGKGWYVTTQQPARWTMLYVTPRGKASVLIRAPSPLAPDVFPSPDGHHLAFSEASSNSNVWLLENF